MFQRGGHEKTLMLPPADALPGQAGFAFLLQLAPALFTFNSTWSIKRFQTGCSGGPNAPIIVDTLLPAPNFLLSLYPAMRFNEAPLDTEGRPWPFCDPHSTHSLWSLRHCTSSSAAQDTASLPHLVLPYLLPHRAALIQIQHDFTCFIPSLSSSITTRPKDQSTSRHSAISTLAMTTYQDCKTPASCLGSRFGTLLSLSVSTNCRRRLESTAFEPLDHRDHDMKTFGYHSLKSYTASLAIYLTGSTIEKRRQSSKHKNH
ncbi:hypothetical protein B0H66DRAFT_100874 [Apodospora peruviana]|uniref:Uncharacterized protein n=1 Tax=Apodospora peruviana TaxID=516989 RepID=A0AAE0HSD0_9PEZI|nr:hypothetical protein B0H66DRAFT_100874 [Apodospora peruviana]